jgi:hypothetical protein
MAFDSAQGLEPRFRRNGGSRAAVGKYRAGPFQTATISWCTNRSGSLNPTKNDESDTMHDERYPMNDKQVTMNDKR